MQTTHLANEWSLLQNQCDSYEKYSLVIKLIAIVLPGTSLLLRPGNEPAIAAVISVLWLQDAIWKTFQHRIETRLLQIEGYLAASQTGGDSEGIAYQFNTAFLAQRQRGGILKEYLAQALRPTVAFPYAALLILLVLTVVLSG